MSKSFGQRLLELAPADARSLERESGASAEFSQLDALAARVLCASVGGQKIATIIREEPFCRLNLLTIADADRDVLRTMFGLSEQQKRGAWFLQEQGRLYVGIGNLPYHFRRCSRFSNTLAHDEFGKIDFRSSAEALFYWSVLEPLFDLIYRPFALRSSRASLNREAQIRSWKEVEDDYKILNLPGDEALAVFRFGGGWSKLRAADQIVAKARLLDDLGRCVADDTAAYYRIVTVQRLLHRYYECVKRGPPKMRRVLTRDFQRGFSAYFGGDWLALLRYAGETPHPDERIATALPEPKLYVTAQARAATVAAAHGLSADEIERILQAFWRSDRAESPVQRRVRVLRTYWEHFDGVHSKQAPGHEPLWGFVEESQTVPLNGPGHESSGPFWFVPGSYRKLLPPDLLSEIEELWSGLFLLARPEAIVSAPSPHGLMAAAFGPALRFWHGVALTAWFVSEGPYSRTDMAGLAKYHGRDLSELAELGCPVDTGLFTELIAAEKKLGPPTAFSDPSSHKQTAVAGMTLTMNVTIGSTDGFRTPSRHRYRAPSPMGR